MKTEIYADYAAFCQREDKTLNGVTQEFLDANPSAINERGNEGCWNCSDCSYCSDCSDCSDCYRCSRCSDCSYCSRCSYCSYCSDCSGLSPQKTEFEIPVIANIHQAVYAAYSQPNTLDMGSWHSCGTTHCRAGWVETLAGEAGKKLAEKTSTEFAAMQIYKASSPIRVSPVRFYESDDAAMADMKRCAEEEAAQASA